MKKLYLFFVCILLFFLTSAISQKTSASGVCTISSWGNLPTSIVQNQNFNIHGIQFSSSGLGSSPVITFENTDEPNSQIQMLIIDEENGSTTINIDTPGTYHFDIYAENMADESRALCGAKTIAVTSSGTSSTCNSSNCAWGCPDTGANICNRYSAHCEGNTCVLDADSSHLQKTNTTDCKIFGGVHSACGTTTTGGGDTCSTCTDTHCATQKASNDAAALASCTGAQCPACGTPISPFVGLDGVGKTGDRQNPAAVTTLNVPTIKTVNAKVEVFDGTTSKGSATGTITYSDSGTYTGLFTGSVNISSFTPETGKTYTVKLTVDAHLTKAATNQTLTASGPNSITFAGIIAGDVVGQNDTIPNNHLQLSDYAAIMSCIPNFSFNDQPKIDCTADIKKRADLNLDSKVNEYDYTLFLRELQSGQIQGD